MVQVVEVVHVSTFPHKATIYICGTDSLLVVYATLSFGGGNSFFRGVRNFRKWLLLILPGMPNVASSVFLLTLALMCIEP